MGWGRDRRNVPDVGPTLTEPRGPRGELLSHARRGQTRGQGCRHPGPRISEQGPRLQGWNAWLGSPITAWTHRAGHAARDSAAAGPATPGPAPRPQLALALGKLLGTGKISVSRSGRGSCCLGRQVLRRPLAPGLAKPHSNPDSAGPTGRAGSSAEVSTHLPASHPQLT